MNTTVSEKKRAALFSTDKKSALEAISMAQFIAFAPYVFQASVLLRDKGILQLVANSRLQGISLEEACQQTDLSPYAVRVLMEAGLGIGLLYRSEDKYLLSKVGHFFLNDEMTKVNTNFMRDVCYDGAQNLEESLLEHRPAGLHHLGEWPTIYQGLSILPEPAKTSWFEFDHYYSDHTFPLAMPLIFDRPLNRILDIGGNTGKFSLQCLQYNEEVQIGVVDLPVQIEVARHTIDEAGFGNRVHYYPQNILEESNLLPEGYDVIWMSQFLDCFADEEIEFILKKCYAVLPDGGRVFINETFWDRQKFEASAFSLQMTSLYFTTMANGNSQMYDSQVFIKLVERAGFSVAAQHDQLGLGHTILILEK